LSVKSSLLFFVGCRDHDSLNPFFDTCVYVVVWPRSLFNLSAPSQVHVGNATVLDSEQHVIGGAGMCNCGQLRAVPGMLEFTKERRSGPGPDSTHGFRN
jgi:hypothetical protein